MISQALASFPLLFMGVCVAPWGAAGWRLFSPMRVHRHLLPQACDFPLSVNGAFICGSSDCRLASATRWSSVRSLTVCSFWQGWLCW